MREYIQIVIACVVILVGLVLLIVGVATDPVGEIHGSLLVAFGEALTFSGSLLGVDYHYRFKQK